MLKVKDVFMEISSVITDLEIEKIHSGVKIIKKLLENLKNQMSETQLFSYEGLIDSMLDRLKLVEKKKQLELANMQEEIDIINAIKEINEGDSKQ